MWLKKNELIFQNKIQEIKRDYFMISIIVPVYNAEKTLDMCLKSLVGQTYTDLQILLINDGSTDRSYEICCDWEKKDSRIMVVSK